MNVSRAISGRLQSAALSCYLYLVVGSPVCPELRADDCSSSISAQKGTTGPDYGIKWKVGQPFYATVIFTNPADASTAGTTAVLCYTQTVNGVTTSATWSEDQANTRADPVNARMYFAFTPIGPIPDGTGKGTIIVTQATKQYNVNGSLIGLTQVHSGKEGRPDGGRPGTWPPVVPANMKKESVTFQPDASWQADQLFHVRFKYADTNEAKNFTTAVLKYQVDGHESYWPMTYETHVDTDNSGKPTGWVDLWFRPYAPPARSADSGDGRGTGKGTIIITQCETRKLVDYLLDYRGSTTFDISGP